MKFLLNILTKEFKFIGVTYLDYQQLKYALVSYYCVFSLFSPPGYTVRPHIPKTEDLNGGVKDPNGTNISGQLLKNQPISPQHSLTPFQVPGSSIGFRETAHGNLNIQGSPLKVEKLIQSQIEVQIVTYKFNFFICWFCYFI